jgi:glycerophosphoryl diester phosphodiesterase
MQIPAGVRRAWPAALLALGPLCVAAPAPAQQPSTPRPFDVEGHRGARGLAPENTLAAFRRALALGVTTLETDVAVTKDDVAVISHNPELSAELTRDASGRWLTGNGPAIRSLTLAELRRYDVGRLNPALPYAREFPQQQPADGERVPTLRELLQLVRDQPQPVRLNLETKVTPNGGPETADPATFVRLIVDAVREANLDGRVTIQSFDWRTLREVKRVAPEIPTSCLTIESKGMDTMTPAEDGRSPWHGGLALREHASVPALVAAAGCATWSMFWRNLTPALVGDAHARNLKVLPWTVNDPADMRRLIDMGVDGIITDYPDRLRRVADERTRSVGAQ